MQTVVIKDNDLSYAVQVIKSGGLVGVPTETVYGLAANGFDADAVAKIYELKGRPETKPLSLLVSDIDMATSVCADFPISAQRLADAFWPGPLTIVLPSDKTVPEIVTAGGSTVGVRCPNHPKTLELIRLAGVPIAAPSANMSGEKSPKCAGDVLKYFDGKIACVIDGGICTLGIESTIVALAPDGVYKILRQGALAEADIERALCIS